jgi:hypothetical protein
MRTKDPDITSTQIISHCEKEYGKGELFFRADGLEFEARRAQLRSAYLQAHPVIEPEHREAILKSAVTPGMTREEVSAAWGLLEEDTRMVFGHVTEDGLAAYAYFNGFRVGRPYTLYLKNEFVVGITEGVELVEPHELELTMRLAEKYLRMHYFYPGKEGVLVASDVDQVHIDWDTLHLHLYTIETVSPYSWTTIEREIEDKGVVREYELEFVRRGLDSANAPEEVKLHAALTALPYHPGRDQERQPDKEAVPSELPPVIALPPKTVPEFWGTLPPDEWRDYIDRGGESVVAFPASNGEIELVKADCVGSRQFRVREVPLWVNDVGIFDLVEVGWQANDVMPHFKQVIERGGYRTVRAVIHDPAKEESIKHFARLNSALPTLFNYEEGVLTFTIRRAELDRIAKEWLSYLPLTWMYTDTLSQD